MNSSVKRLEERLSEALARGGAPGDAKFHVLLRGLLLHGANAALGGDEGDGGGHGAEGHDGDGVLCAVPRRQGGRCTLKPGLPLVST